MSGRTITSAQVKALPPRSKFVTVSEGMSGHFAVIYWLNPDMGGFWEPYDTGIGRYPTEDEARVEAIVLSESEGVPYLMPDPVKEDAS